MRHSDTEIFASAAWLVDLALLDAGSQALEPQDRIERYLTKELKIDDAVARKVASRPAPPADLARLLGVIDQLCHATFELRAGLTAVKHDVLSLRVHRVVDPDVLMTLDPRLHLPNDEPFDGSAIFNAKVDEARRLLERESFESHVHLGGMLPPWFFWVPLVTGSFPLLGLKQIAAPRRGFAPPEVWMQEVARAMWLRCWLAAQMRDELFPHLPTLDDPRWAPFIKAAAPPHAPSVARDAVVRLRGSPSPKDFLLGADPGAHTASGERRLLHGLVRKLRRAQAREIRCDKAPEVVSRLLAYMRIRNAFYQALIHSEGSYGLTRFVDTFRRRGLSAKGQKGKRCGRRNRRLRRDLLGLEKARVSLALSDQLSAAFEPGDARRNIEIRVALDQGPLLLKTFHAWLSGVAAHLKRCTSDGVTPRHHVGFVVHLLKRDTQDKTARRALDDAHALGRLLTCYPWLRKYIVGADAAGPERGAPPRLFVNAFRHLRSIGETLRPRSGEPPVALGWTYHVGEDIWDLLTGCRHIDEAVSLIVGRRGRLGHALAAADDPRSFYERRGKRFDMPLRDHLFDLVWGWGRCREARAADHAAWLRARLLNVISEAEIGTPYQLNLDHCWFKMGIMNGGASKESLDKREILACLGLGRDIDPSWMWTVEADAHWVEMVAHVQALLRARLAREKICIESNPTSNLLVGGYDGYADLPYDRFTQADIPMSINTDDPGLFSTSLPLDVQHVLEAKTSTTTTRDALTWVAARLLDAQQYSFIGPSTPGGAQALHELGGELHHVLRYSRPPSPQRR